MHSDKMYSVPSSLGAPSLLSLHLLHLPHLIGKTDYPGPPHANNQGQHLIETGPIRMSSGQNDKRSISFRTPWLRMLRRGQWYVILQKPTCEKRDRGAEK